MPVGLFMSKINPLTSVVLNSTSSVVSPSQLINSATTTTSSILNNNTSPASATTTTTLTPTASILFTENNICINNNNSDDNNNKKNSNLISTSGVLAKENDTHLILVNTPLINKSYFAHNNNEYSSSKFITANKQQQLKYNLEQTNNLVDQQVCDNTSQINQQQQQHIYFDYNNISDEMNKQQTFLNENSQNFLLAGNRLNFNLAVLASSNEQTNPNLNYKYNNNNNNQNRLLLLNQHENHNEKQGDEEKEEKNENKKENDKIKNDQNNYAREKIDNFRINLINNSNESTETSSSSSSSSSSNTNIKPSLIFSSSNPIMFETTTTTTTTKTEENINNFLNKINNENNDNDNINKNISENKNNSNEDKNNKIILNENSILTDKNNNTNVTDSYLFQMQHHHNQQQQQQTSKSNNTQFISIAPFSSSNSNESKQNSNSNLVQFLNDEQNNFNLIIIDNLNNKTSTSNSTMNSTNLNCQITNNKNQEFDLENLLIQHQSQIGIEINQQENNNLTSTINKNNIDHAIDAVLAKCCTSNTTVESSVAIENKSNLIKLEDSTNNSTTTTTSAVTTCTPSATTKKANKKRVNNSKTTKQIENKIPTNTSTSASSPITPTNSNSSSNLMSKSSKARTSYISSLIANRDKPKEEDSPQVNHNSNGQLVENKNQITKSSQNTNEIDDKQKRISQNILSILATANNNTNTYSNHNGESKRSDQFIEKSNYVLTGSNLIKTSIPQQPSQPNLPVLGFKPTNTEYSDLINILNDDKLRIVNNKTEANIIKTDLTSDIDFILNNNDLNHQSKLVTLYANHSTKQPTYLECTNLKRFLDYPIMQDASCVSLDIDNEYRLEDPNFENILLNSSFDKIQIVVKNVADVKPNLEQPQQLGSKHQQSLNIQQQQQIIPIVDEATKTPAKTNNKRKRSTDQTKSAKTPKKRSIKPDVAQPATPTLEKSQVKVKKLKTIADIVKHNSTQQQLQNQQHQLENLKQETLIKPKLVETNSDLTLTWLNQNSKNDNLTNQNQMDNSSYYTSPHYILSNENNNSTNTTNNTANATSQLDIDQIDHLLELEFNNVSVNANQQSIDKYIDLDEIDVNPLISTNLPNNSTSTNPNNHLDEFNFQFSVCSSTSSGFSEPSNYSTSSTSSIASNSFSSSLNGVNNTNMFSSESESSPYQYDTSYQQQQSFNTYNNKKLAQSIAFKNNQHNDIAEIAKKLKSTRNYLLNESNIINDDNISTNALMLINNQQHQQQPLTQCINNEPNFVGNFSFFTDEIGAGI